MAVRSLHSVTAEQYQHFWDNSVPPVLTVRENEPVTLQTRDSGNDQIKPGDGVEAVVNLDFSRVNPISGPIAIEAIREFGAVYLMAVGGAAYLVSKAIIGSRQLAFADLGMEGIYEFEVKDMPVTVAVDSKGTSVHQTGPAEWQQRIANIPILQ